MIWSRLLPFPPCPLKPAGNTEEAETSGGSVPGSFIELCKRKCPRLGCSPKPVAIFTVINNPGSKCPVTLKGSCSYGMKPENKGQRRRDDGGQEREMGSHHPQAPQVYP